MPQLSHQTARRCPSTTRRTANRRRPAGLMALFLGLTLSLSACMPTVTVKPLVGGPLPQDSAIAEDTGANRDESPRLIAPDPKPLKKSAPRKRSQASSREVPTSARPSIRRPPTARNEEHDAPTRASFAEEDPAEEESNASRQIASSPAATRPSRQQLQPEPETNEPPAPSVEMLLANADKALARGEAESARKLYQYAATLDATRGAAYAGIGASSVQLGDWEVAFINYRKALDCPDASPEWRTARSDIGQRIASDALKRADGYARSGDLKDAEQAYLQAADYHPDDPKLWLAWGRLRSQTGDHVGAAEKFAKAQKLDPNSRDAYLGLAEAKLAAGDADRARQVLQEFRLLFGADATYQDLAARCGGAPADAPATAESIVDAVEEEDIPEEELGIPPSRSLPPAKPEAQPQPEPAAEAPPASPAKTAVSRLTRGELAGLLVDSLDLAQYPPSARAVVVLDTGKDEHRDAIDEVLQRGIMEPFANHTFRPAEPVSRGELAAQLARILALRPGFDKEEILTGVPMIEDVPPYHRDREAIELAVVLGVLDLDDQGRFRPQDAVTDADAQRGIALLR